MRWRVSAVYNGLMADFNETLSQIRELAGETISPDLLDGLVHEYQSVQDRLDGATVQITEKDGIIQSQSGEISRLKSANYDLMLETTAKPVEQKKDESERPGGIRGLFIPRK